MQFDLLPPLYFRLSGLRYLESVSKTLTADELQSTDGTTLNITAVMVNAAMSDTAIMTASTWLTEMHRASPVPYTFSILYHVEGAGLGLRHLLAAISTLSHLSHLLAVYFRMGYPTGIIRVFSTHPGIGW